MYKYNISVIPDIINSFYVTNSDVHSYNTRNRNKIRLAIHLSDIFCQLGPRYEGQLTRMAEPIPPSGQSTSYTLTTLSLSKF